MTELSCYTLFPDLTSLSKEIIVKTRSRSLLSTLTLVLLSLIAACGQVPPQPVEFSSLPVFLGGEPTSDPNYLNFQTTISSAFTGGNVEYENVSSQIYALPPDTNWDDVEKFYTTELDKGGWKFGKAWHVTKGNVTGTGWMRGQQLFLVYLVKSPAFSDAILITGIGSSK